MFFMALLLTLLIVPLCIDGQNFENQGLGRILRYRPRHLYDKQPEYHEDVSDLRDKVRPQQQPVVDYEETETAQEISGEVTPSHSGIERFNAEAAAGKLHDKKYESHEDVPELNIKRPESHEDVPELNVRVQPHQEPIVEYEETETVREISGEVTPSDSGIKRFNGQAAAPSESVAEGVARELVPFNWAPSTGEESSLSNRIPSAHSGVNSASAKNLYDKKPESHEDVPELKIKRPESHEDVPELNVRVRPYHKPVVEYEETETVREISGEVTPSDSGIERFDAQAAAPSESVAEGASRELVPFNSALSSGEDSSSNNGAPSAHSAVVVVGGDNSASTGKLHDKKPESHEDVPELRVRLRQDQEPVVEHEEIENVEEISGEVTASDSGIERINAWTTAPSESIAEGFAGERAPFNSAPSTSEESSLNHGTPGAHSSVVVAREDNSASTASITPSASSVPAAPVATAPSTATTTTLPFFVFPTFAPFVFPTVPPIAPLDPSALVAPATVPAPAPSAENLHNKKPESHEDVPELKVKRPESHEDVPELNVRVQPHQEPIVDYEETETVREISGEVTPSDSDIERFNAQAAAPSESVVEGDSGKLVPIDSAPSTGEESSSNNGAPSAHSSVIVVGKDNSASAASVAPSALSVPAAPSATFAPTAAPATQSPFVFPTFAPFVFPTVPPIAPSDPSALAAPAPAQASSAGTLQNKKPESHEDVPELKVKRPESHEDVPELKVRVRPIQEPVIEYEETETVQEISGEVTPSESGIERFNAQAAAPSENIAEDVAGELVPFDSAPSTSEESSSNNEAPSAHSSVVVAGKDNSATAGNLHDKKPESHEDVPELRVKVRPHQERVVESEEPETVQEISGEVTPSNSGIERFEAQTATPSESVAEDDAGKLVVVGDNSASAASVAPSASSVPAAPVAIDAPTAAPITLPPFVFPTVAPFIFLTIPPIVPSDPSILVAPAPAPSAENLPDKKPESHEDVPELNVRVRPYHKSVVEYEKTEIVQEIGGEVTPSDLDIERFNAQAAVPSESVAKGVGRELVPFDLAPSTGEESSSNNGAPSDHSDAVGVGGDNSASAASVAPSVSSVSAAPVATAPPTAAPTTLPFFVFPTFAPFVFPTVPLIAPSGPSAVAAPAPAPAPSAGKWHDKKPESHEDVPELKVKRPESHEDVPELRVKVRPHHERVIGYEETETVQEISGEVTPSDLGIERFNAQAAAPSVGGDNSVSAGNWHDKKPESHEDVPELSATAPASPPATPAPASFAFPTLVPFRFRQLLKEQLLQHHHRITFPTSPPFQAPAAVQSTVSSEVGSTTAPAPPPAASAQTLAQAPAPFRFRQLLKEQLLQHHHPLPRLLSLSPPSPPSQLRLLSK